LAIADRALAIDPNLADAHAAKGVALSISGRRSEAAAAFEKALAIDPNSIDANLSYARFCMSGGLHERAVELLTRSLELQPEDPQPAFYLNMVYRSLGRVDDAERYARLGVRRAEEAMKSQPGNSRPAQGAACVLAALGEKEEAKRWLERALELDPDDNNALYNAACAYAQIDEPDLAFDVLERWSKNVGSEQILWFKNDNDLDPLRDHPRYQRLISMIDERAAPTHSH
jgi:adenylate cyclase